MALRREATRGKGLKPVSEDAYRRFGPFVSPTIGRTSAEPSHGKRVEQPTDVEEHEILNGVERRVVKFNLRRCVECGALFADRDDFPSARHAGNKEELKEIFGPYRDVTHI